MPAPWPWRATLLTAVNCYLLWGFTWFQFVITLSTFSYTGQNLWFHALEPEPFGATIPETFLAFSIALSVFALGGVMGGTWGERRLWKRMVAVGIFAAMLLGFSGLNLHLRQYSYAQALLHRHAAKEEYQRILARQSDPHDEWTEQDLEWQRELIARYDEDIRMYREKYGPAGSH